MAHQPSWNNYFPSTSVWSIISFGAFFSMIVVAIVSLHKSHKSHKSTTTVQKCDSRDYATSAKNNDNNETSQQHEQGTETKTETEEVRPSISEDEVSALLHERFQGLLPIDKDRNQKICDKFVLIGIFRYANGSFDENTLGELTFDEFCDVYDAISWFVEKAMAPNPKLKEYAALYKKFLKPKPLARLSTFPVYTIYSPATCLPYRKKEPFCCFQTINLTRQ